MAFEYFRVYHKFVNDQKWRTIARAATKACGREIRIGDVISIALGLLTEASANANERGRTKGFNAEDFATMLDIVTEDAQEIYNQMQGRFIQDLEIIGWKDWQPLREDGSAERGKAYRERQKELANATERNQTLDKTTLDNSKQQKPIVASDEKFDLAWARYPRRPGANKAGALKAWNTQIKRGTSAEDMLAGVERYRAYCDITGKTDTEFVKMAATFFGPQKHFELTWEAPSGKEPMLGKFDPVSAVNRNRVAQPTQQGFENVPTFDEHGNPV